MTKSETSTIVLIKTFLESQVVQPLKEVSYIDISTAFFKNVGEKIPSQIRTSFGSFKVPFWETMQDIYKSERLSILVSISFN